MQTKPRVLERIFRGILPLVALELVRQGKFREEHLADPKKLLLHFHRHGPGAVENMKMYIAIESNFYKNALAAWKRGDRSIGIVLFATAIERW